METALKADSELTSAGLLPSASPSAEVAPETAAPGAGRRRRDLVIKLLSALFIVGVWTLLSVTQGSFTTPSVPTIVQEMGKAITQGDFVFHMSQTLKRVAVGFVFAFFVGGAVGVLMGRSRDAEAFFDLQILTGLMLPGLAWAILSFMWMGVTDWAALVAIALVSVPTIAITIMHGTKAIDPQLLEMATAYRINQWLTLRHVILPQLYPYLFGSIRNGFALAWKVVVLSEMLGLSNGVGYQIFSEYSSFRFLGVLAWTLLFAAVMFLLEFGVFQPMERRLTRWRS